MTQSKQERYECRDCEGFGYVTYEAPITDWNNGHDIWTEDRGCEKCCGVGWVDEDSAIDLGFIPEPEEG